MRPPRDRAHGRPRPDVHSDDWLTDSRTAVYVSGSPARPPTLLPGRWERDREPASRERRAPGRCSTFVIAPGADARADALSDARRATLRALAATGDDGGVELLYIGEQGGRREPVVQALAHDRASATGRAG